MGGWDETRIVIVVCRQAEIVQQAVGERVAQVAPVELQAEELTNQEC